MTASSKIGNMRTYNNIERPDFTPRFIKSLKPDEIFVFGSNLACAHGGGAARTFKISGINFIEPSNDFDEDYEN